MASEFDALWDEHSRLVDRMMDAAQREHLPPAVDSTTIRVRLSLMQLWWIFSGKALRFKTNNINVIIERTE
jgi:hypothetical protein